MINFVLASKSPRRIELFKKFISHNFIHLDSNFDERHALISFKYPFKYVKELAIYKAKSIPEKYNNEHYILISSDTIVYFKGKILNKPNNYLEAFNMLKSLSNNVHKVYTAYAIFQNKKLLKCNYDVSFVYFNFLTDEVINNYISKMKPFDKAGAYGIQEQGKDFKLVKRYRGSYFNIMGLPIEKLKKDLKSLNLI